MKFILKIFAAITILEISVFIAVYQFFLKPVQYEKYIGDTFSCNVPKNSKKDVFTEWGWHKHKFTGIRQGILYISHKKFYGNPKSVFSELSKYLQYPSFQTQIKVFENGIFHLFAVGKRKRRYVYLFTYHDNIFWIEEYVSFSSSSKYKEIADAVVKTFEMNNDNSSVELERGIKTIDKKIWRYTQSSDLLLFIIVVPSFIIFFAMAIILYFSGKLPKIKDKLILKKQSNVYVAIRQSFSYNGTLGAVILFNDRFAIYLFGKEKIFIDKNNVEKLEFVKKGNNGFIKIKENNIVYSIYVDNPYRWYEDIKIHFRFSPFT